MARYRLIVRAAVGSAGPCFARENVLAAGWPRLPPSSRMSPLQRRPAWRGRLTERRCATKVLRALSLSPAGRGGSLWLVAARSSPSRERAGVYGTTQFGTAPPPSSSSRRTTEQEARRRRQLWVRVRAKELGDYRAHGQARSESRSRKITQKVKTKTRTTHSLLGVQWEGGVTYVQAPGCYDVGVAYAVHTYAR
jgi:hypothetical protein